MTDEELQALPPLVDVNTAARAFDTTPTTAYRLIGLGQFPVEPIRIGRKIRFKRAEILRVLGIDSTVTDKTVARQ
jgi:predicted DNA-binding transcriptional regulator AlpA